MAALWDRLRLDETEGAVYDGERRYLLMRPDVLMGMLRELPPVLQERVLAGFAASACRQGGKSVDAYRTEQGGEALCDIMIDSAASLGWGRWTLRRSGPAVLLEVVNSPFAAGHGPADHAVCAPIAGIFCSLASTVLACETSASEFACAAQGREACRFIAVPAVPSETAAASEVVAGA